MYEKIGSDHKNKKNKMKVDLNIVYITYKNWINI
jgi:hypothetical protein